MTTMALAPATLTGGRRQTVRLVIVDDHVFMRDLMVRMLQRQRKRYEVVAAVGTANEAIAACDELKPDLLILDINLPDRNGIDAIPDVKRVAPATRVLLCTGFPTDDRISNLASTGADGFVEKTNSWDEFLQAIEKVSCGDYYFCSRALSTVPEAAGTVKPDAPTRSALTAREKEILTMIAQGSTSKEIGAKLHISVATVETHRTNLMNKLGVRNATGLVAHAFRTGLARAAHSNIPSRSHRVGGGRR